MPIRVDAYVEGGIASGEAAGAGHLRDIVEQAGRLMLQRVWWRPLEATGAIGEPRPIDDVTIPIDDLLVAVADDESLPPTHATWHALRIEVGPWVVLGEMPTLPGFDPDRALARPTGEFVLLRDVQLGPIGTSDDALVPVGEHALINRYDVVRVAADLMLGFFFPGAEVDPSALPPPPPVVARDDGPSADVPPTRSIA